MRLAIAQAERALAREEVPVGAVAVRGDDVVAASGNLVEARNSVTGHAELVVLETLRASGERYFPDVRLYVTLEPCPQCAGALLLHRLGALIFGASDPKWGAGGSVTDLLEAGRFPHTTWVKSGVLAPECSTLLLKFFARLREEASGEVPKRS